MDLQSTSGTMSRFSNLIIIKIFSSCHLSRPGAVNRARFWNSWNQMLLSTSLNLFGKNIHITRKVREMLFEGYADKMLSVGSIFENDTPFNSVGLLIEKNATDLLSGNFSVKTGFNDMSNFGLISKFNGMKEFPFFSESLCKQVIGSTDFHPPKINIDEPLVLFTPSLCRPLKYEYLSEFSVDGVLGKKFVLGEKNVDNGTKHDDQKCFQFNGEQLPTGLINVSMCNWVGNFQQNFEIIDFVTFIH